MKPVEFRRQIFRDATHWDHGLSYKLERLDDGGLALFSRPTFSSWALQSVEALSVHNFALDHGGRIFWIRGCELHRYDPISLLVEPVVSLARPEEETAQEFGKILSAKRRLFILDRTGSRVIILRPDNFQIIAEIESPDPIDIAWGKDRLFVLDRKAIAVYDVNGTRLGPSRTDHLWQPVAIGANPCSPWVYVLDDCACGFRRFKTDGSFADEIGKFSDVSPEFRPRFLVVHSNGNLFAGDGSSVMHEFAPDGSYLGNTGDLTPVSKIFGATFSPNGGLHLSAPEGIANLSSSTTPAGTQGVFYSGTLDSGGDGSDCWHRLDLLAELDAGGTLDVSFATSDRADLAHAVEDVIKQTTPVKERTNALDQMLDWKEPDVLRGFLPAEAAEDAASESAFRPRTSHSVLLRGETKRYLWIKVTLSGLVLGAKVTVREMRAYYPRLSYLRYLPAVYQEDPASREFLQRFLSVFETVFSGLESTIERIPESFDPDLTPKEFLDWLAQWVDLGVEEEWKPEVKRRLISRAAALYQRKGRPDGLIEFIEIVTGERPIIHESFAIQRPAILGEGLRLGRNTRIFRRPTKTLPRDQFTVLGVHSKLGASQIRSTTQVAIDPFRAVANHFTLVLNLSPQEFKRHERGLHRIIRENSPAHVGYDIRLVSDAGVGPNMVLGVNLRVENPQPFYVGQSSLGRSVLSGFSYGPELGIDATLAGQDCGSTTASEVCYGEQ